MASTRTETRPVLATPPQFEVPLFAIVTALTLTPALFVRTLDVLLYLGPVVLLGGVWALNSDVSLPMPTWMTYNMLTILAVLYGSYALGTQVRLPVLVVGLVAFALYDTSAQRTPEDMNTLAIKALKRSLPIAILIPHSEQFEYEALQNALDNDALEATFEDGPAGVTMLGVVEMVLPGSLAVALSSAGSQFWIVSVSPLALGVIAGAALGLAFLLFVDLETPPGIATVALPSALLGLLLSLMLTDQSLAVLWF